MYCADGTMYSLYQKTPRENSQFAQIRMTIGSAFAWLITFLAKGILTQYIVHAI